MYDDSQGKWYIKEKSDKLLLNNTQRIKDQKKIKRVNHKVNFFIRKILWLGISKKIRINNIKDIIK